MPVTMADLSSVIKKNSLRGKRVCLQVVNFEIQFFETIYASQMNFTPSTSLKVWL